VAGEMAQKVFCVSSSWLDYDANYVTWILKDLEGSDHVQFEAL
jgi:hypothetical protein